MTKTGIHIGNIRIGNVSGGAAIMIGADNVITDERQDTKDGDQSVVIIGSGMDVQIGPHRNGRKVRTRR